MDGEPLRMLYFLGQLGKYVAGKAWALLLRGGLVTGPHLGMTVAIIGLPGGLALPEDFAQLKEMTALREKGTKPGLISAWEVRGRELVLYWRDLAPDAKIDVNLDVVARLPGNYRGPAPRAYLYYNADNKF